MALVSSIPYLMIVVLGGLVVDMRGSLGASYVALCVPLIVLVVACFLSFCCLCDITPKRRVGTKEPILSRRVLANLLSWVRAVLFMSCVFWPFVFMWVNQFICYACFRGGC